LKKIKEYQKRAFNIGEDYGFPISGAFSEGLVESPSFHGKDGGIIRKSMFDGKLEIRRENCRSHREIGILLRSICTYRDAIINKGNRKFSEFFSNFCEGGKERSFRLVLSVEKKESKDKYKGRGIRTANL